VQDSITVKRLKVASATSYVQILTSLILWCSKSFCKCIQVGKNNMLLDGGMSGTKLSKWELSEAIKRGKQEQPDTNRIKQAFCECRIVGTRPKQRVCGWLWYGMVEYNEWSVRGLDINARQHTMMRCTANLQCSQVTTWSMGLWAKGSGSFKDFWTIY
jgi:hypothetical protein